ncbi:hypothetical protein MPSEU_000191800 [Mayamaea pseudoterrestris]|nr:hypothetical protein MPSEU_000191800 [Mayamaea pseudoterrestris]
MMLLQKLRAWHLLLICIFLASQLGISYIRLPCLRCINNSTTFTFAKQQQTLPDNTSSSKSLKSQPSEQLETAPPTAAAIDYNSSKLLPQWLKDYVAWHQRQRSQLNESNWNETRYFVQRCLRIKNDDQCGGTSDRLRSLPLKVKLAAKLNRLFLIHWQRPTKLEEFLVPPPNGLDWTVPDWLVTNLNFAPEPTLESDAWASIVRESASNATLVDVRHGFGAHDKRYNDDRRAGETDYDTVYHEIWNLVFTPSAPVQAVLNEKMRELRLVKYEYNAVHIRSKYLSDQSRELNMVEKATNCGLVFGTEAPLYVATDSLEATKLAVQHARKYHNHVTTYSLTEEPMHIDRGKSFLSFFGGVNYEAKDYYSVFVDFYILAYSKCLSTGRGGYSNWANLLRPDRRCGHNYWKHGTDYCSDKVVNMTMIDQNVTTPFDNMTVAAAVR